MNTIERAGRIVAVEDGRLSYRLKTVKLGWERLVPALETHHGTGKGGFEYASHAGSEPFTGTGCEAHADGFDLHGTYRAPGLEETVELRLTETGALRLERRIRNTSNLSLSIRGASISGDGADGGPIFSDNHIWRARFAHMDNVRTERYPWCRPEYPYVRPVPKTPTVFGSQENQSVPAMILTNDTNSQALVTGQLQQSRTRLCWTLAAGPDRPFATWRLHWGMPQGGFDLQPGEAFALEPVYFEILESTEPQDCLTGYCEAILAEQTLLDPDDTLLSKAFYCSWNYGVFHDISEAKLLETARFVARHMPDVKHFLIDGGWQSVDAVSCPNCANFYLPEGEWHHPERFPNGMRVMADRIRETGLRPAIWWTPSVALHSRLAQEHPEWLAKDVSGNPYRISHSGYLDLSLEPVQAYLHRVFTILFKDWGYEAMKMDFWGQGFESERIRFASGTGMQWRDWLLTTIRSYLPADGFLMTCVAVSMGNPFLGKGASSYRCSIDVGACAWHEHVMSCVWNLPLHALPSNRLCLPNVDGIGWNPALPDNENLHRLTYAFITMGSLEVDGRLEKLPPDTVALLNRVMADMDRGHPVRCPDRAAFTGVPLPRCLTVAYPDGSRTRARGIRQHVAFFNWGDDDQVTGFTGAQLGLRGPVDVEDFWTGERSVWADGGACLTLPPRTARLYTIREA